MKRFGSVAPRPADERKKPAGKRRDAYLRLAFHPSAEGAKARRMTWRVFRAGRLIGVGQQSSPLRRDCTVAARLRFRRPIAKGETYVATVELNDRNGIFLIRQLAIRGR
jgi:hypothetical protein